MRVALPILVLVLAGCCSAPIQPSVFPEVGELSDAEVVEVLRERTAGVTSLYAVLTMSYDGPDRNGTFDTVLNFMEPGTFRFTAFKDLVLAEHDIFDLVLSPPRYQVLYEAQGDDGVTLHEGTLEALPTEHPRFSGFAWTGTAFFLPGVPGEDPVVEREDEHIAVKTTLLGGAAVTWICDPRTLEVRAAYVTPFPGRELVLTYGDYREYGGRVFPGKVTYVDRRAEISITAEADEVEVDPVLEVELFELEAQ